MPITQVREGHWQAHAYTNEGLESCGKNSEEMMLKRKTTGVVGGNIADSWDVCSWLSTSIFFKIHVYCDDCIIL